MDDEPTSTGERPFVHLARDLLAGANVIRSWAQLLRREPLDARGRDVALGRIEAAASAQIDALTSIVGMHAIDAPERGFDVVDVDLATVLDELLRRRDVPRGIVEGDLSPVLIHADRAYVARLVESVIDAARGGPKRIVLSVDEEHANVRIEGVFLDAMNEQLAGIAAASGAPLTAIDPGTWLLRFRLAGSRARTAESASSSV